MYRTYKVLLHKLESRINYCICTFLMYIILSIHNRESFQAVFRQKVLPGITANFCSNNSDGRIWAFYFTYLTLDRDNPGIGLIHFVRKLLMFC